MYEGIHGVRMLLDTHAFIWFAEADDRLSQAATDLLSDPENPLYLSCASTWEIAIKTGMGKLILSALNIPSVPCRFC